MTFNCANWFWNIVPWPDADSEPERASTNQLEGKAHLQRALEKIEKDSMRYKQWAAKPWLGKDGEVVWSKSRVFFAKVVVSQSFETFMGIVIFVNLALMIFETNSDARCYPEFALNLQDCKYHSSQHLWLLVCTIILQLIYTAECMMRAYAERSNYVWNRWNQVDLWTAIMGWAGVALSSSVNLSILRILRVLRLIRVGRLVISVPELYILLSGLTTSFKPILFGSMMLISVILVWSIIVVELLHPITSGLDFPGCPSCHLGFDGVYAACLTLFAQIVAGDSWSQISIPFAKKEPWTAPILFFIMMTVSLGVMNLILAVIVEKAAEARENDQERKQKQVDEQRQKDMVELAVLCDRMDNDGSGALSLQEMLDGFDNDSGFQTVMQRMDIERSDMETVFHALDDDASGELDYVEFCHQLGSCKRRDPLMLTALTRYNVMEVKTLIQGEVSKALEEQRQMLEDQLELLAQVPSCATSAKELQRKRLEKVNPHVAKAAAAESEAVVYPLGKSGSFSAETRAVPKLQTTQAKQLRATLREQGHLAPTEKAHLTRQRSGSFGLLLESLTENCKVYQDMQNQLESLMASAERLKADIAQDRSEGAENERSEHQVQVSSPDFDRRFEQLLRKFYHRTQREEVLQAKFRKLIESISLSLGRESKQEVVQNEL